MRDFPSDKLPYYEAGFEDGFAEGYKKALQQVTTVQQELPLTLDGEEYEWPF